MIDFGVRLPSPEDRLAAAQAEGLEPNVQRALAFVDLHGPVELQALNVRRRPGETFTLARAAHATTPAEVVALAKEAEGFLASGVYVIPALLRAGVETRHSAPGRWFDVPKGGGTSDSDIATRRILAVDCDVTRPGLISATDAEMSRSVEVAGRCWEYLAPIVGAPSLALVHSGNGRQIWIAIDVPAHEEARLLAASLLAGLEASFGRPTNGAVKIDVKLFDAKRILPACGTTKKKGASGIAVRPHRRTAIVIPETVRRLGEQELRNLHATIRASLDAAGRAAMDDAQHIKVGIPPKPGQQSTGDPQSRQPSTGDRPFDIANAQDTVAVAEWLDLFESGYLRCPGCGESAGVTLLDHGLKCHHDRCANKGRRGFRTNVDLTMEVRGVGIREAHDLLAGQFGFEALPIRQGNAVDAPAGFLDEKTTGFFEEEATGDSVVQSEDLSSRLVPVPSGWITERPPPREYLARDVRTGHGALEGRGVYLLVAAGGAGKSYATVALALAVGTQTPWLGTLKPERAGRVLIVSAEEPADELRRRLYYVAASAGVASLPEAAIDIVDVHDMHMPLLDAKGNTTGHAAELVTLVRDRGPYDLVIADPLARLAGAPIDVDNVAAAALISTLEGVSSAARGLVLAVHHTDKGARRAGIVDATAVRGATGLGDSARMVMVLSVEQLKAVSVDIGRPDVDLDEIVTIRPVKMNHVRAWAQIELRRGQHGELLPLTEDERVFADMTRNNKTTPGSAKRATREAERLAEDERNAARLRARAAAASNRSAELDATVREIVGECPGIGTTNLRTAVRAKASCGADLADVAVARLVAGRQVIRGGGARAVRHYLPADAGLSMPKQTPQHVPHGGRSKNPPIPSYRLPEADEAAGRREANKAKADEAYEADARSRRWPQAPAHANTLIRPDVERQEGGSEVPAVGALPPLQPP